MDLFWLKLLPYFQSVDGPLWPLFTCSSCAMGCIGTNTDLMEFVAGGGGLGEEAGGEIIILFFWILHFAES